MPVPLPVPPLLSMLSHKSTGIRKTHLLWVISSHSSCRSGISMWCCSQGTKAFPSEGSVRFFWAGFPISKTWFAHSGPQVRGRSQKEKRQLRWGWQQRGETKLQLLSHGPTVARFFFLENPRKKCWPTNSFFFIYKHHLGVNTPHLWARHNGQTLTAALLPRQTLWFCITRNGWTERPSAFLHRLGACSRCRFSAPPTC